MFNYSKDKRAMELIKANRINHVGIIVENLEDGIKRYGALFGITATKIETTAEARIALLPLSDGVQIELIELNPENEKAKALAPGGAGLHHICLEVDNVDEALASLALQGEELWDAKSRPGVAGPWIGFIAPSSAMGVPVELVQMSKEK
jgi:methylmalonyl-CoA/ethylmalonyl-CoA epimerase